MNPSPNTERSPFFPYPASRDLERRRGSEPCAPDPTRFRSADSVISLPGDLREGEGQTKFNSLKGSWHWDIRTDTTSWSEQLYWIIGREHATIPPFKEHSCFHSSESWIRLVDATSELLEKGTPYELKLQMLHSDGTRRWVIRKGEAVRDAHGSILELCGTLQPISEWMPLSRKADRDWQIESNAENATSRLIQAHEAKNAALAIGLRDNICQRVSLLAAEMQSFRSTDPDLSIQAKTKLQLFWQESAGILAELDRVSNRLYPFSLDLLGLPLAMRRLCREFTGEHGIPVEYTCSDVPEHPMERQCTLILYRILEELLANIVRRSGTNRVAVDLDQSSAELILKVADNRVGFEQLKAETAMRLGVARIQVQIGQIGGRLAVWSQQPCGTLIEVRIPLAIPSELSGR